MDNKDRKVFFTDLDATLLDDEKGVPEGNVRALERILAEGHAVAFTTGRVVRSTAQVVERLGFYRPGCYLICYNGGEVYDIGNEKTLYLKAIPMDLVKLCFDIAEEEDIYIQTYAGSDCRTVLAQRPSVFLDDYCRIQMVDPLVTDDVMKVIDREPPKLLAIEEDRPKLDRFRERVGKAAGDRLDLYMSTDTYLEVVPPGVSKGDAVRFLCEHLGVPIENSVAAGDAENDISMIREAGVGAAMANAEEAVKEAADYVTKRDNNHSGVGEILDKFIP